MKKHLKILKECTLFEGITDENIIRMLSCMGAKVITFDKKYTILQEGKPAKYIGIMLSGTAQIVRVDYYGNRSIISEIHKGELFGEAFACAGVDSVPVTVVAEDACEVMLIESGHILHTCENHCGFHGQLIFNLMKDLAQKTLRYHKKIEITSKRSTREKLMTYLLFEAERAGADSFEIPFDRQELADYLDVDRSGLSAEISKLRREGVLECEKNRFVLL